MNFFFTDIQYIPIISVNTIMQPKLICQIIKSELLVKSWAGWESGLCIKLDLNSKIKLFVSWLHICFGRTKLTAEHLHNGTRHTQLTLAKGLLIDMVKHTNLSCPFIFIGFSIRSSAFVEPFHEAVFFKARLGGTLQIEH